MTVAVQVAGTATAVEVHVTRHARDRLAARTPISPRRSVNGLIRHEVRAALLADRIACHRPRWCSPTGERQPRRQPVRFVWNEERSRCYVLRKAAGGAGWIVLTTMRRLLEERS